MNDGQMYKRTDGQMDNQTDEQTDILLLNIQYHNFYINSNRYECMIPFLTDEQTDRYTDRQMDKCSVGQTDRLTSYY